jgi:hypothetical protein
MTANLLLLACFALAFYNVGTIWAHEVDIFRTWRLVAPADFRAVQSTHWRKLPFWVFIPVGLTLGGSVWLVAWHPGATPAWLPWSVVGVQIASHILTALLWGPWQGKLSRDPAGPQSAYLKQILRTHWIRTLLISLCGGLYLYWVTLIWGHG